MERDEKCTQRISRKRPHETTKIIWKDNIKKDFTEIGHKVLD
jgi:hypothetical protein